MSGLPEGYLDYPLRKRGMDHDRYPYRALPQARPVAWPGGARVALWVAVHVGQFPMDMPLKPFVAPGGMERPYPSYWDYTQRDYGNRIGIYRMMKAMGARNLKATALISAAARARISRADGRHRRRPGGSPPAPGSTWATCTMAAWRRRTKAPGSTKPPRCCAARFGDAVRGWHSPAHSESPPHAGPRGRGRLRLDQRLGE